MSTERLVAEANKLAKLLLESDEELGASQTLTIILRNDLVVMAEEVIKLRKGLENIKKHMEAVLPNRAVHLSGVYKIACEALSHCTEGKVDHES